MAEHLLARGIVADAMTLGAHVRFDETNVARTRAECRRAADAVWQLVEVGAPPRRECGEEAMLRELIERVARIGDDALPQTTTALNKNLEVWYREWTDT